MPLHTVLPTGATVEIMTTKNEDAGPSEDWLKFVRSSRARTKIRQYFAKERRLEALLAGREMLTKSMRNSELPLQKMMSPEIMTQVAQLLHKNDVASLYRAIGEHESRRSRSLTPSLRCTAATSRHPRLRSATLTRRC